MKRFILNIIVLLTAVSAIANDRLYIRDFEIVAGESKTIALILDNDTAYSAFQTDIYLSDGLEIEQEDGEYIIDLNSERTAKSHVVSTFKREDGAIRVFVTSQNLATFNSGDIAYIQIKATNAFPGSGTISLKNSIAAESDATRHILADSTAKAGELSTLKGDVNGDGEVNIADINAIIGMILSGQSDVTGDVNGDSEVNIADINNVIEIILGGTLPEPSNILTFTINDVSFTIISVEGVLL